jgi:enoyl-CoA hydratase/carnithine racemase
MVLTTMADILIAAHDAQFSYPEVKVGFSGGLIATLAARIPHKVAMELLLMGEVISAERAYQVGYVNRVVPAGELDATALDWSTRLAANAPLPARMLKRFVAETVPRGPSEQAGIARSQVEQINASADWEEGRAAFFEKREPRFKGN